MLTKKLYQEDVYKRECTTTILEVQGEGSAGNPYLLVLEETVFFPDGGGQPCDLGTINGVSLTEVYEKDGVVFHKLLPLQEETLHPVKNQGKSSSSAACPEWNVGDKVECRLDWERRFEHMQRHCGEHILSGVFFQECGGVNKGFHMGSNYMTIDIDVPEITPEDARRIELLTNQIIWSNVPVSTRYYVDRSEAEKLPLRKPLAIDEDITVVCVGDEKNPADCVACCGTHPSTSGQVGLLKILKLESYKGMTRVYFKAGKEALLDYQDKHNVISKLNQKYSSDDSDLLDKIKAQDEKNKEIRQQLYQIKHDFIAKSVSDTLREYGVDASAPQKESDSVTSSTLLIREYPFFQANDLLAISKTLTASIHALIVLIATQENTLIIGSSGKHDCGKIVKDNAHVWRGKGGGNANSARAMFPTRDELDCFITFIKQAY